MISNPVFLSYTNSGRGTKLELAMRLLLEIEISAPNFKTDRSEMAGKDCQVVILASGSEVISGHK